VFGWAFPHPGSARLRDRGEGCEDWIDGASIPDWRRHIRGDDQTAGTSSAAATSDFVASGFGRIAMADSHETDSIVKKPKSSSDESSKIRLSIEAAIRRIPKGKVSTYGAVARAAGLPGAARQVAQVLHRGFGLPWQRVLGAGGEIKLRGDSAVEQRLRLEAEGVRFRGRKVDMKGHEFKVRRT
jgi:methylated-DNA-protein-cysteine methyltransferase-like protein